MYLIAQKIPKKFQVTGLQHDQLSQSQHIMLSLTLGQTGKVGEQKKHEGGRSEILQQTAEAFL